MIQLSYFFRLQYVRATRVLFVFSRRPRLSFFQAERFTTDSCKFPFNRTRQLLNFLPGHFKFQPAAVVKTRAAARGPCRRRSQQPPHAAHTFTQFLTHTQLPEFIRANAKVGRLRRERKSSLGRELWENGGGDGDDWLLKNHFSDVPVVRLALGSSLNPEDIEEGDDVYFECKVNANPIAYKVVWKHNVRISDYLSPFYTF